MKLLKSLLILPATYAKLHDSSSRKNTNLLFFRLITVSCWPACFPVCWVGSVSTEKAAPSASSQIEKPGLAALHTSLAFITTRSKQRDICNHFPLWKQCCECFTSVLVQPHPGMWKCALFLHMRCVCVPLKWLCSVLVHQVRLRR